MSNLLKCVFAVVLSALLCSCAAVEVATAKNDDERDVVVAMAAINPVVAITGVRAFDEPSQREREANLPEYVRTIRDRNVGRSNSSDRRITLMAMQNAYPILSARTEKEVVALHGPPDERIGENSRTGLIYRINGIEGGQSPVLFVNPD